MRLLMAAYQRDRLEAFDRLHGLLRPRVHRFVMLLARDATEVDDLVQDAFLQLHRVRHTYDLAHPVLPWVFAIARNTFLMSRRARRRRCDVNERYRSDVVPAIVRSHEGACIARRRLGDILSSLPPGAQRAVILHLGLGLSAGEVGVRLGIATSEARVRLARAVVDLRRIVRVGAGPNGHRARATARPAPAMSRPDSTVGLTEEEGSAESRAATSIEVVAR